MLKPSVSVASNNTNLEEYALERLATSPLRVLRTSNNDEKIMEKDENASPKPITNT